MQLNRREHGSNIGFFQLSRIDPTQGFHFDWKSVPGNVYPKSHNNEDSLRKISSRLLLGAHLAEYLRGLLKTEQGFTCSAGICTSKIAAKLGGTVHKPDQQTLLMPNYLQDFLDIHEISKIPGIGSKTARSMRDAVKEKRERAARNYHDTLKASEHLSDDDIFNDPDSELEAEEEETASLNEVGDRQYADREDEKVKQLAKDDAWRTYYGDAEVKLKVVEARTTLSKFDIETMFANSVPNGTRVWNLLHGLDGTEVVPAASVPTQISIEDTFKAGSMMNLQAAEAVMRRLCINLIRRMHADLLSDPLSKDLNPTLSNIEWSEDKTKSRWMAYPKTIRLSTRDRYTVKFGARISKSAAMPNIAFSLTTKPEDISDKLVKETLAPLFRRMHTGRYDLALINVAAVNMSDGEIGTSAGHIGEMFKRYNEVFPDGDWEKRRMTTTTTKEDLDTRHVSSQDKQAWEHNHLGEDEMKVGYDSDDEGFLSEDDDLLQSEELQSTTQLLICEMCGAAMPVFAVEAHETYHRLENG